MRKRVRGSSWKAAGAQLLQALLGGAEGSEQLQAVCVVVVVVWSRSRWWRACLHAAPLASEAATRRGAAAPHGCSPGLRLLLPGSAAARCVAQCPEQTFAAPLPAGGEDGPAEGGGGTGGGEGGPTAGAGACQACHYSCVACAGPAAGDCTRCHGDAEPRPSLRGLGRFFCRLQATDSWDDSRAQWWLVAGAVSASASLALLLALAAWWCASRRRLAAPAAPGRPRAASGGRRAAYVDYRRLGAAADDDDDGDDEEEDGGRARAKDAAASLCSSSDSEERPRPSRLPA